MTETGIGYARRSSLTQRDNTSLPDQVRRIQAHAVANNIELHEVLTDDGESGSSYDRPALWEAISKLKCIQCEPRPMPTHITDDKWQVICQCEKMQGLDALIVWDFKRFGRDSRETIYLCLEVLDKLGKRLIICDGNVKVDTSTPMGRFMLRLMAAMAELDREELMGKFDRGREYIRKTTDKYAGNGQPPYGFKTDGERKQGSNLIPVIDENDPTGGEFRVLKYIWVLKYCGFTYRRIAERLNKEEIRARKGGLWHETQVWRILSEERYSEPQVAAIMGPLKEQAKAAAEKMREEHLAKIAAKQTP